ncbi:FAD-dependent monooxygenase [Fluoribacter gormanii]|uniref:FAD binding domain-containing protein n=1 Tax=Fluoribacter gormanii TaxID=464 RepID=UPI001EE7314E|nr:FAD-dependent monooxygenase [Fluoribacter gormanii]MCW8469643.1 FAD-dependent monooxygenase [Fluoribacter gormanii]
MITLYNPLYSFNFQEEITLKVGIIGGSIAGCALALLLKDQFQVTVFERADDLKSRGAGITISIELLNALLAKNLIDQDTLSHTCTARSFYCQADNEPVYGKLLWQQGISMTSLHWDTLFSNLRKRIPDPIYLQGVKVIDVQLNNEGPGQITLESGKTLQFDLIVFADGVQSLGRQLISNVQPEYSGYVAWRGTLEFERIQNKTLFNEQGLYYCFNKGHLLTYPVYHHQKNKLNWVFYEKIALEDLENLGPTSFIDFSVKAKEHLYQLAHDKLPQAVAQIILDTQSPFMQKIVDVCAHRLVTHGALLLGDASTVLRPHVGNGASLAIQDALSLSEHLWKYDDFQQAIKEWEKDALPKRVAMYDLSKRMADALVLHPVEWQEMNESKMQDWWEQIILGEKWYTTSPIQKEC